MFQELPEGQTHSFDDGCGEKEHNKPMNLKDTIEYQYLFSKNGLGKDVSKMITQAVKNAFKEIEVEKKPQASYDEALNPYYAGFNGALAEVEAKKKEFLG